MVNSIRILTPVNWVDVSKNGVKKAKVIFILDIHNCMTAFDILE